MAAWGTGLYQDDVAEDVKEDYYNCFREDGLDNKAAYERMLSRYSEIKDDTEDGPIFWMALSDVMWDLGKLNEEVKEKAYYAADSLLGTPDKLHNLMAGKKWFCNKEIRMSKYLKTQEMKEYIQNKGRLLGESAIIMWDFNIYFEKAGKNKLPGKYVYSDKSGYHNADIGDRGGIACIKHYTEIEEISYDVFKFVVYLCANARSGQFVDAQYQTVSKSKFQLRKEFELELLKKIDINYFYRYKNETQMYLKG